MLDPFSPSILEQREYRPGTLPKIVLCFTGAFLGTNFLGPAVYQAVSPFQNQGSNMHIMQHPAGRSLLATNLQHNAVIFHVSVYCKRTIFSMYYI